MAKADVASCITNLRSENLSTAAKAFRENSERIAMLSALPFVLVTLGHARVRHQLVAIEILSHGDVARRYLESPESRAAISQKIQERLTGPEDAETLLDEASEIFMELFDKPELAAAYDALILSNVANAWSMYESLARDAWISALNACPIPLGHAALRNLPGEGEELARKQVSLGFLAKFGFDLRSVLGSVLASKFDFTSAQGIGVAYRAAFGEQPELSSILSAALLERLEATRHVIVHSAGWVDAEFCRRVSSPPPLGTRLTLTRQELDSFIDAVETTGCALLRFLDDWLEHHRNVGA